MIKTSEELDSILVSKFNYFEREIIKKGISILIEKNVIDVNIDIFNNICEIVTNNNFEDTIKNFETCYSIINEDKTKTVKKIMGWRN